MKDAQSLTIDEALERLSDFDAILDARSPSEFAEDHLPAAQSAPVLDDAQRAMIGTLHKQVGAFEAKRIGAALVSRNIAALLEGMLADKPRDWRALVYCWRGGNRSGSLATVLARVGWRIAIVQGGYREFRRRVIADLAVRPGELRFVVVAGRTGSGKSLLLERLAERGAQVLDLERLAAHRGSVLGRLPGQAQPSQKRFETRVWERLRNFDPSRPVFVESESRKVGQCQVTDTLIHAMRASRCVVVDAPDPVRVDLLMRDYRHLMEAPQELAGRLEALVPMHGRAVVDGWLATAHAGMWDVFVAALLHAHYDPAYDRSMQRNFPALRDATTIVLDGLDAAAIDRAAAQIEAAASAP
jgi:tRNA 2-selenouridine synthase